MGAVKLLSKHRLIIIFAAGLLLRLSLSVVNYNGDVNTYIHWAKDIYSNGTIGFFDRGQANYPPLTITLFYLSYSLYLLIGSLIWKLNLLVPLFPSKLIFLWENQKNILPAFIKIPAILADIGIAYFIYLFAKKLIKQKKSDLPIIAASLVLFNPAFFYNSSYWGQIEALPLFFVLGSFYLLLYTKLDLLSAVIITLGFLTKQTIVVFAPLYTIVFVKNNGFIKLIKALIACFIIFLVIFFPFVGKNNFLSYPAITYWNKIMTSFGSEYLTAHAFNFWGLTYGLGHIPDSKILLLGISVRWWSLAFITLLTLIILLIVIRRKFKTKNIITAAFLIPLFTFLFSTRMHERHLESALPFLLLAAVIDQGLFGAFIFVSMFHFLNLYEGWWSPPVRIIIDIFSNKFIINFLIVLLIFLSVYLLFRYVYKNNKRA